MIKCNKALFLDICKAAESLLGASGDAFVEVEYVDENCMQALNLKTRGIDKPTDVLSFPMLDGIKNGAVFSQENYALEFLGNKRAVLLGTIVICTTVARAQAAEFKHSLSAEKKRLFAHGLLHLFGYDHENDDDYAEMSALEERLV